MECLCGAKWDIDDPINDGSYILDNTGEILECVCCSDDIKDGIYSHTKSLEEDEDDYDDKENIYNKLI